MPRREESDVPILVLGLPCSCWAVGVPGQAARSLPEPPVVPDQRPLSGSHRLRYFTGRTGASSRWTSDPGFTATCRSPSRKGRCQARGTPVRGSIADLPPSSQARPVNLPGPAQAGQDHLTPGTGRSIAGCPTPSARALDQDRASMKRPMPVSRLREEHGVFKLNANSRVTSRSTQISRYYLTLEPGQQDRRCDDGRPLDPSTAYFDVDGATLLRIRVR